MNIDQRLERLTERHEALTQTVQLIAAMQRDNEKRFEEIGQRFEQIGQDLERDGEHIRALGRIAELHHERPNGLERNLEG